MYCKVAAEISKMQNIESGSRPEALQLPLNFAAMTHISALRKFLYNSFVEDKNFVLKLRKLLIYQLSSIRIQTTTLFVKVTEKKKAFISYKPNLCLFTRSINAKNYKYSYLLFISSVVNFTQNIRKD